MQVSIQELKVWVASWYDAEDYEGDMQVFLKEEDAEAFLDQVRREHSRGDRLMTVVSSRHITLPKEKQG